MQIRFTDYNDSNSVIATRFSAEWGEIEETLQALPVHLQPSDEATIQGTPIFDPKATNVAIKNQLGADPRNWHSLPVPAEYQSLGSN